MKRISALIIAVLSAVVFGSCSLISNHYYQQNESGSSAVNSKPAVNSATAIESQTVKEDHATTAPVTDNPQSTPNENAAVFNDTAPFYGIWVYASKSYDEAKNFANDVSSNGFNGYTENTTHWSNLNDEEWNVVTAGKYATETEAVNQLSKVKEKYPDAYVKYSGEYQLTSGDGDPAFYGIWVYASKSYDEAASFAGDVSGRRPSAVTSTPMCQASRSASTYSVRMAFGPSFFMISLTLRHSAESTFQSTDPGSAYQRRAVRRSRPHASWILVFASRVSRSTVMAVMVRFRFLSRVRTASARTLFSLSSSSAF